MTGWLWLLLACAAVAAVAFCLVRLGPARLRRGRAPAEIASAAGGRELPAPAAAREATPDVAQEAAPAAAQPSPRRPRALRPPAASTAAAGKASVSRATHRAADAPTTKAKAANARARTAAAVPDPTAEQPQDDKLALWASEIAARDRKMTVATDGCRVTWDRTCKHGHPSWVVHLGYLAPGETGGARKA